MKRKLGFLLAFILIACGFTSCELDSCKVCRQVTYVDEVYNHEGNSMEYCGTELIVIEATADVVDGNTRTAWECD